jgi:DNA-directed RNA polymerase subunit RPC12/RpoP
MTTLVCFGCGNSVPDGLNIWGQYLCPDCEMRILHSNVAESDYQHWIEVLRKFWESTRIDLRESDSSN